MKNFGIIIILILIIIVISFMFKSNKATESQNNNSAVSGNQDNVSLAFPGVLSNDEIMNKKALIKTGKGDIEIQLYNDKAPKTVSNFIYLANKGFYNGLTFHRVEPGFVVQGGDPDGNGAGGPGYNFLDEPVQGNYLKGAVAMANSGPDTNGSQFFICLEDQSGLPKQYNLFGQVISGMDVVSKLVVGDKMNTLSIETMSSN